MNKWVIGFAVLLLAGCGGPAVKQDMNVQESEGSTPGFRSLTMSAGWIDEAGRGEKPEISQLNPWVEIDRKSGMAGLMGVTLQRVVGDPEIFRTHAPRYLAVGVNDELHITVGDSVVVLRAMEESKRWHKNRQDSGGFRTTTYFEEARYQASAEDMELLAKGPISRISASGKKGGTYWPRQDRKLLPDYQGKFAEFHKTQIAPAY